MNGPATVVLTILLLAMGRAECSEVAFIGLADEGAPAIEHQFNRILKEQIAMIPGVHLVDNAEVRRLQSQIGLLSYPAISTSLAASLRRCVPDTALVIWGRVKSCSIRAVRKRLIHAELEGNLCLELAMYTPLSGIYSFVGDIQARATRQEGYCAWFGPIDEAIQVAAPVRSELLDSLQYKASVSAASTVKTIILNKKSTIAETGADSAKPVLNQSGSRQQDSTADSTPRRGQ